MLFWIFDTFMCIFILVALMHQHCNKYYRIVAIVLTSVVFLWLSVCKGVPTSVSNLFAASVISLGGRCPALEWPNQIMREKNGCMVNSTWEMSVRGNNLCLAGRWWTVK